jgi:hypothetical protein
VNEVWQLLCYVTHCFVVMAETSSSDEWSFVVVFMSLTPIILIAVHQDIKSLLVVVFVFCQNVATLWVLLPVFVCFVFRCFRSYDCECSMQ